ncbi:TcpE family conjugal transfer membrane protein [Actinomadura sp. NPDC048032]|uniref:TcpE family conjugal transfer membrane protein n=1 Tax=Actinomadura sp. NPDC048032 TaxID=3155747 RepID=UPI0033DE2543
MDLPTYTNIWRIEKRLYKLYDLRLPMPLPLVQIGVFLGVFVPWIVLLRVVGIPFASPWHVLYIVPPGVLTWLATRPVIEGKRLTELLLSQGRYLAEPRTWCRLTPIQEPREVVIVARVWRRTGSPAPAAAMERAAIKTRRRARRRAAEPEPAPAPATTPVLVPRPAAASAPPSLVDYAAQREPVPATPLPAASEPVVPPPAAPEPLVPPRAWRRTTRDISHEDDVLPLPAGAEQPPATPRLEVPPPASPPGSGKRALASGVRRPGEQAEFWQAVPAGDTRPDVPQQSRPDVRRAAEEIAGAPEPPRHDDEQPPAPPGVQWTRPAEPGDGVTRQPPAEPEQARDADGERVRVRQTFNGEPGDTKVAGTRTPHPAAPAATRPDIPTVPGAFGAQPPQHRAPEPVRPTPTEHPAAPEHAEAQPPQPPERPATQGEPPAALPELPAAQGERPPALSERPATAGERPTALPERPAAHGERPPALPERPAAQGERPAAQTERPAAQGERPPALPERPAAQGEGLRALPERPPVLPEQGGGQVGRPPVVPGWTVQRPPAPSEAPRPEMPAASAEQASAPPVRPAAPPEQPGVLREPPRPWSKGLSKPQRPDVPEPVAPPAQDVPPVEPPRPVEEEAPPREVRSQPASPVRPRPLPPPPAPPPSGPAITPPGPEHEVTSGGLRRLIHAVGGGHGEVDADYQQRIQQPFHGTRHVVVLGCTGGAGQTVTALMLGHTFAQHNGEPVVAIDVNPGPGALARRTRSDTNETLTGLITRADQVSSLTAMRRYTSQAKSGLDVIAAGKNPLQALDDRDYALAIRTLDKFYSVTLLDAAAAVVARVLPYADQIVLVAPASADAPRAVAMTFEWLDGHGYEELRSRAVTVINGVSRRSMDDVEQAEAVARGRCRALVRIPWDDHLSMDRAPRNELKSLRTPTRRAYLALAGVVAGGFTVMPERYQELQQEQEATR